jgi:hypothetical protein
MEYIMVMRCSDTGYIHVEPLRSRSSKEMVTAFEKGENFFRSFDCTHNHVRLDNETSATLKESFRDLNISAEYVAPNNHRQNAAERDIRTFKNHFIATLSTADPCFPLDEWDLLLPQSEMTLNLMRPSRVHPELSAWEDLRGRYDFNRHPIAPLGTRVTVFEDPESRGSWHPHGVRGFYVAPALDHYRCFKVLVEDTRRTRITDSVTWHPREEVSLENIGRLVQDVVETTARRRKRRVGRRSRGRRRPRHDTAPMATGVAVPPAVPSQSSNLPNDKEIATPAAPFNEGSPQTPQMGARRVSSRGRVWKPNRRYLSSDKGMTEYGGLAKSYRVACRGDDAELWHKAACEEFERLIDTTETMKFIPWEEKPKGRIVSYYNPQIRVKIKDGGAKEYRVRGTYGGNISDYLGPKAARTADMTSIKILLNAVASEGAEFMTADIKDFYLGTPMQRTEYMRVHLDQIPPQAREKYVAGGMANKDGYVLAEISKGIYGLAQAGRLAQQRLCDHLAKHGYRPISKVNPCVFKHEKNNVVFCLVVDDFGVKYKDRRHAEHLMDTLKMMYTVKEDWQGRAYVGFDIRQDRERGTVTLSMPRYIDDAAERFNIDTSVKLESPAQGGCIDDGGEHAATDEQKKRIQQIVGVLLYYARAVDPTIIVRVSKLSSEIATATVSTLKAAERVLQYAATNPRAEVTYHKSEMKLTAYSDASYLTERNARSRRGGVFFLGDHGRDDLLNGPILCCSSIIDVVVSSAAESEYAAAYLNAREATHIRDTLEALGYPQGATHIISDNSFVCDLVSGDCKAKKSRCMDMRFFWLKDRVEQGQFCVKWHGREQNIADYFTKDLPTKLFAEMRPYIVLEGERRSVKELVGTSKYGRKEGDTDGMVCEEGVFRTEIAVSPKDTAGHHKPRNRTYCSVVRGESNNNLIT